MDEVKVEDSILLSVKKLLGLLPEITDFDQDILMNINSAISTLRQLGVGPPEGYIVYDKFQTYDEYLNGDIHLIPDARMYLYYRTKIGWDSPTSGVVNENIKDKIRELEWRLNVQSEFGSSFESEVDDG